jgi:ribosomal protein S18 acetylase RimI-like enzyme
MAPKSACRMRRLLDGFEPPKWPAGISLRSLQGIEDAKAAHALLSSTYEASGDALPAFGDWWGKLSGDAEFDAGLCFLAFDQAGELAGVAQCWTGAFLKDLAVRPDMRRQGLGRALLHHCFAVFRARGKTSLDLKADTANLAAIRVYESAGMVRVAWEG